MESRRGRTHSLGRALAGYVGAADEAIERELAPGSGRARRMAA